MIYILVVLGRLGGSFGGLGGSWAALGRLLGGLEAVLDRSWAALSRHGSLRVIKDLTRTRAGVALDLGSILGRFGCRLGRQKSSETVCFKRFRENSRF